jgi:hypothetical protein
MIRHVRAHGHGEQLHRAAEILPVPDRRQFHQRVRSGTTSQASGQARYPARGQRRPDARGYRALGQVLTSFHRLCHRGQSAAQQVTLPAAARTAVTLERGRDRIRDLAGRVSFGRRHQRRGRVNGRRIHDGVKVIAELLLRGPQDRLPSGRMRPDGPGDAEPPVLSAATEDTWPALPGHLRPPSALLLHITAAFLAGPGQQGAQGHGDET